MKKIVVTGANGQLGNEIRDIAAATGHQFVFTDIDELDLTSKEDTGLFLEKITPDYIINCAAYTAVDNAETNEDAAMLVNATVPEILSNYVKNSDSRIIHISTDYVFPGNGNTPLKESDPTGPDSVYGKSKLKGEQILSSCDRAMIIRTSWLYSSYGRNFVKNMFGYIEGKKELRIVNDQHGSPCYARDLAAAIIKIIAAESKFRPGIYHYANKGIATWYELTMEIRKYLNSDSIVHPIDTTDYPLPAPRPQYSVLNTEKISKEYDVHIPFWKESLTDCLDKISGKNKLSYEDE